MNHLLYCGISTVSVLNLTLNRVPCPEVALQRLVVLGESVGGDDLLWVRVRCY